MRSRASLLRAAVLAASALALGSLTAVAPAVTAQASTIDTTSAAAVAAAYNSQFAPSLTDTIGWTGSVASCTPGTTSASSVSASLNAINYVRSLAGLDPVSFTSTLSQAAQKAALMMSAHGGLSHDPTSSWKCYTSEGADAAGSSDLAYGAGGARVISPYMSDPGSGNSAAGHRRWILFPPTTTMGTGSTDNTNALYVFGNTASAGNYANPSWVPWPTSGYFPEPLQPNGRWSLSGDATHDYDFSHAKVSVKTFAGTALSTTLDSVESGYGSDTLVWEVAGLATPAAGSEADYTVSVTGIVLNKQTVSHNYVVRLFNPSSVPTTTPAPPAGSGDPDPSTPTSGTPPPPPPPAVPATVTGFDRVGQTLHSTKPVLSFTATRWTYRWYRSGIALKHGTHSTHKLVAADLGKTLSVRVTGHRAGHHKIASTSAQTIAIQAAILPSASVNPTISGLNAVGQTLTADPGVWVPSGAQFSYHWYRNGKKIKHATAATRVLSKHDRGRTESVRVTITAAGYSSRTFTVTAGRVAAAS